MPGFVFTQQLGVTRVASITQEKKMGGGSQERWGYRRWKYKNNYNKIQTGFYSLYLLLGKQLI
jgi:hypothetical protein